MTTMTPDDHNPPPTLPDENLEAACLLEKAAKSLCWGRPVTIKEDIHSDLHRALTLGSRALTEWPRPVTVTADAWELASQVLDAIDETPKFNDPALRAAAVLAPVVRERDQLRAEIVRLEKNLYTGDDAEKQALRAEVERLQDVAVNGAGAKVLKELRAQLAAAQEALERIATYDAPDTQAMIEIARAARREGGRHG